MPAVAACADVPAVDVAAVAAVGLTLPRCMTVALAVAVPRECPGQANLGGERTSRR
jgi:hypothetical protein